MINEYLSPNTEPIDLLKSRTQRPIKERTILSVRNVITFSFALWFILSLAITLASIFNLSKIEKKLNFMESVSQYIFEVQQARRFEKNYFLYGTNLDDSLEQTKLAENILEMNSDKMIALGGEESLMSMRHHINLYEELLSKLQEMDRQRPLSSPSHFGQIEGELRKHGAEIVAAAENLVARERQSINHMIFLSKQGPMLFLVFLLGLMVYCVDLMLRRMIRPLNQLVSTAQRIADGDITTPMPIRRYRNEFTELSIAINSMMHQLSQRREQLIKGHKLKAVGRLSAGVAHELNNPVNNIMLTASMLQEDFYDIDDGQRMDMINDLVQEANRSQKIIRNLLELAREREADTSLMQLNDVLEETLHLVSSQLKRYKVKTECNFTSNLPPVSGDRQQLIHVFLNLVLNAVDAMPDGGILVIETLAVKEGDSLKVNFTDSGNGIPHHVKPHIFNPFFTTKSNSVSTGLGLSVSLGIVRKHGGDILAESQIGKGSTFSILLPTCRQYSCYSGYQNNVPIDTGRASNIFS